jgi:hypothetical protein
VANRMTSARAAALLVVVDKLKRPSEQLREGRLGLPRGGDGEKLTGRGATLQTALEFEGRPREAPADFSVRGHA